LRMFQREFFFLRLKGIRERSEYLAARAPNYREDGLTVREEVAVRNREIFLGMSKELVMQSWGRPLKIDVAGDPVRENERWLFYSYGGPKYVYFESGRVRGWASKQD
ncbi:MAG: hypothetical protein HQK53_19670, partial [Oligoflexia bacterium]|nr:hypothetical protein [Oligoflexia bacterium]